MCILDVYYFMSGNFQLPVLHFVQHTFLINLLNSIVFFLFCIGSV